MSSRPFQKNKTRLGPALIGLCLLLVLPLPALGSDWPWGAASNRTMGTAVLVTAPGLQRPPGPLAVTSRLDLYACGYPGCQEGDPFTLTLRSPAQRPDGMPLTTGYNHRLLALDLPPGTYRLARLESAVDRSEGRLTFEYEVHYLFNIRAGRTTYLGRLVATPLNSDALLIWSTEKRGRIVTGETLKGRSRRQVFHLAVEEHLAVDTSAVMRAYPERNFYAFGTEKLEWMAN